ncbi:MAG: hypothetical protein AAF654_11280 [Myxococcota bacterium]
MSLPPLLLEKYAKGELSDAKRAEVAERIAQDPEAAAALEALEASDAAILAEIPPGRFKADLEAKRRGQARTRGIWLGLPAVAAAAIAIAVLPDSPAEIGAPEVTRTKGAERVLHLYRGDGELLDGSQASSGDRIQPAVQVEKPLYGVMVAIDGRGSVTLLEPKAAGPASHFVPSKDPVPLTESYELDDAPEFERFFFVTSRKPFNADLVLNAARRWSPKTQLTLPADYAQHSIELRK